MEFLYLIEVTAQQVTVKIQVESGKEKKWLVKWVIKKVTIQSLEVVSIDEERSLILSKRRVPGSIGGWVEITDAKKKSLPANVPYPAGIKDNFKNIKKGKYRYKTG